MRYTLLITLLAVLVSCNKNSPTSEDATVSGLNFKAIANKIIKQADPQPGEKILLVINPGRFNPLVEYLKEEIERRDAIYMGTESLGKSNDPDWNTKYVQGLQKIAGDELVNYLKEIDLGIMLPGATPIDIVYDGIQKVLKQGMGRTIHFHWQGAYKLNGVAFEPDSVVDKFYENVLYNTDYNALAEKQKMFEEAMRNNWIQVTTPAGTNIKFQIGDRQVTKQDGNASMSHTDLGRVLIDREVELPSGAIRVAPLEETVVGTIVFPDSPWNNQMAEGVTISFEKGKVTDVKATKNNQAVLEEMEGGGEAAKSFREFALGFNPMLAIPEENPWIPYYGYGAGVVRLSLGDNTELGGNVTGGYVRWNFFTDATVKVGDEVWVENGKLVR